MSPATRAVGAILVTKGDAPLTQSVLRAIENQSVAPDSLTIIDVAGRHVTPFPADLVPQGAELVRVGRARTLGGAIRRAHAQGAAFASAPWWWILHDDSAPEAECLSQLVQAAVVGKTVGAVGAKQISWDGTRLLELGIFATSSARRLERIGDDEIDQGQYDGTTDVLGVGTAGMLLRAEAYETIGGFDPALGPFGDGLDMGRRLHLAGYRVIVAPRARVRHARSSMTPGIDPTEASFLSQDHEDPEAVARLVAAQAKSFRRRRYAQMYNWCKAVPALVLPFLALWLLVWTPARALGRFITGRAALALPEIAALLSLMAATPRLLAGRARAAQSRTVPRSALRALEITPASLRKEPAGGEEDEHGERIDPLILASMRSYRIRSVSTAVGLLALTSLTAGIQWWGFASGIVGGAWTSLPSSCSELWAAAWAGWIPGGDGYAGGADPLTILMALLSAPVAPFGVTPGAVATTLLVASSPLAAILAWVPTRSLTSSLRVRFLVSLAWALSPALLLSASHGSLAGALAHLAVPVLAAYCVPAAPPLMVAGASGVAAAPVNPRTVNAGCAGLSLLVLACCAPWTLPLGLAALLWRARRSAVVAMPAAVVLAPTYVSIIAHPSAWVALTSTSGGVHAYTRASSWFAALGMPAAPQDSFEAIAFGVLGGAVLALALVAAARHRSLRLIALVSLGLVAAACGWAASHVGVGLDGALVANAWTSPAFSLSFGAFLLAATQVARRAAQDEEDSHQPAWDASGGLVLRAAAALACCVLVAVGATHAAVSFASRADASETPTYALAQRETVSPVATPIISAVGSQAQRSPRAGRVLVLDGDPTNGAVDAALWRGAGPTLTDSSPTVRALALARARSGASEGTVADPAAQSLAQAAYTLVVYPDDATVETLAAHDVDTILVPDGASGAQALAFGLDRAAGLEKVGATNSGTVWRVRPSGVKPSRVRVESAGGVFTDVGASQLRVDGEVNAIGTLILAERADSGWYASVDGAALSAVEPADGWAQAFDMPAAGHLTVTYSAWWIIPWRIGAGICLVIAAASALSVWRKR